MSATSVTWEEYVQAQRGLSAIACAYGDVVESALAAVAKRCDWDVKVVERLGGYASKRLREIIARHAQERENIDHLGESALEQVVVYLTAQKESRRWLSMICQEIGRTYVASDKSLLSTLQANAVAKALQDIGNPNSYPRRLPPGTLDAWSAVRLVYDAKQVNKVTAFLLDRNKLQIKKFQNQVTPFCTKWGVPGEDIERILQAGFALALIRWDPNRAQGDNDSRTFQTTALVWMQKFFWTDSEILRGCPEDLFRRIGIIWKHERLLEQAAADRQPTPEAIADSINQSGGFKNSQVTAKQVKEALAIARTMAFESLAAIAERYGNYQGDASDVDPLEEGSVALAAAKVGGASFPDPESRDFVQKFEALAEEILSPQEQDAFGFRVLDDCSYTEIGSEMSVTEEEAKKIFESALSKLRADPRVKMLRPPTMNTH